MGQISSKTNEIRSRSEQQQAESAYLSGPSGVQFGLQNSSLSVSQGLSQLQGFNYNDFTTIYNKKWHKKFAKKLPWTF